MQGADANGGEHEHGYSALHFAALSGNGDACRALLEAGARTDAVNTVKRTPAQMAAFVGNSVCVAIINNFVPREDVHYFARRQPLEDEPKLPPKLAKPVHKLVMSVRKIASVMKTVFQIFVSSPPVRLSATLQMNTHPVRVALILKRDPDLLEGASVVCRILELMSDREFRHRRDVNEVLSLKFHVLHYVLADIVRQKKKFEQKRKEEEGEEVRVENMGRKKKKKKNQENHKHQGNIILPY